ncbi:MAG: hypothetical protein CMH54_07360 [Myxococcales bacterium]|nr:hypothetical protein [Myxococcales bacterium]
MMGRSILLGWLLLVFCLVAPALASDAKESAETPQVADVPIVVDVSPKEPVWVLGKDHELKVTIRHAANISTFFPIRLPLENFIQKEVFEQQETKPNGEIERVFTYVVTPIRFDVTVLPSVELSWVMRPETGEETLTGTRMVELGRVRVDGAYTGDGVPELGKPGPKGRSIVTRDDTRVFLVIAVGVGLAAVVLFLLLWLVLRRMVAVGERPPIPASEVALRELENLKARADKESVQNEEYVTRLSEILRVYLGSRYDVESVEATSTEILEWAEESPKRGLSVLVLRQMLYGMDLIKFAAHTTMADEIRHMHSEVGELVDKTRISPEEQAAQELQARAMIPTQVERAFALAVDLSVGCLVATPLFLLAAMKANVLLLSLGLGLFGLWMLLRDVLRRSPGKKAAGLEIIHGTIGAGVQRSTLRSVAGAGSRIARNVTLLPIITLLGEAFLAATDKGQRRAGDLMARCRVVRGRSGGEVVEQPLVWVLLAFDAVFFLVPFVWALTKLF